jgi:hypothetical protein
MKLWDEFGIRMTFFRSPAELLPFPVGSSYLDGEIKDGELKIKD